MSGSPDIQRLVGDVVRVGTIASVDLAKARCTVSVGDLLTGPIPWLSHRAGATAAWSPPSVDEQVLLLCPEGDTANGVAVRGIFSDANPAPASADKLDLIRFADGAVVSYDAEAHHLAATLPDGGTAAISAPGGLKITGPVEIDGPVTLNGKMTVSDDVVAAGISLKNHTHDKVQAGSAVSGKPVAF